MCENLSDICRSERTDSSISSYPFPSPLTTNRVSEKEKTESSHMTEALTKKVRGGGIILSDNTFLLIYLCVNL
jgi:hypothetical protein